MFSFLFILMIILALIYGKRYVLNELKNFMHAFIIIDYYYLERFLYVIHNIPYMVLKDTVEILKHIFPISNHTFHFIIKSSVFGFSCRSLTLVQLVKPPNCVDPGTNFERSSSPIMQTELKSQQNKCTLLMFDKNTRNLLNYLYFYPHKASSVFPPTLFFLYLKFGLSLKFT